MAVPVMWRCDVALSGGVSRVMWGWAAVRSDGAAVGHDLAIVFKDDDAIAQEAPALLGEGGDDPSSVVIALVSVGARRLVRAHLDLRGDCISVRLECRGRLGCRGIEHDRCVVTHMTKKARYPAEQRSFEHVTGKIHQNRLFG